MRDQQKKHEEDFTRVDRDTQAPTDRVYRGAATWVIR